MSSVVREIQSKTTMYLLFFTHLMVKLTRIIISSTGRDTGKGILIIDDGIMKCYNFLKKQCCKIYYDKYMHIIWPNNHSFENLTYRKTKSTNMYVCMYARVCVCVRERERERIEKISRCKGVNEGISNFYYWLLQEEGIRKWERRGYYTCTWK